MLSVAKTKARRLVDSTTPNAASKCIDILANTPSQRADDLVFFSEKFQIAKQKKTNTYTIEFAFQKYPVMLNKCGANR